MVFVLVHSPLVGPGTWAPVARELERRGQRAVVPPLAGPGGAPPRSWRDCVEAARTASATLREPLVLAGHSGGGLLLPAVAAAVDAPVSALVFVDSALPARAGETPVMPAQFLDELRPLAVDGVLPPWSEWWGDEALRELVPDDALRSALAAELPSLPLSFLEQRIPSPPGWDATPCAYLLLSEEAYGEAAAEARQRGWPVEELAGAQHLHLVTEPGQVADAVLRLAAV